MNYITYPSSLDFWLNGTCRRDLKQPYNLTNFDASTRDKSQVWLPAPMAIMVDSRNKRKKTGAYNLVSAPKKIPANAFVRINKDFCVASPEFSFLLAATKFTFAQLVELGNCLCASYVYDSQNRFLQRSREPITNIDRILEFLADAKGCYGVNNALKAAHYICEGSGSPMENRFATYFFLPKHYGGYKFIPGRPNGALQLTEEGYRILGGNQCRGDILWDDSRTVFEYDSSLVHTDEEKLQYDARRQTAMNLAGYKVVRFTRETIRNFDKFEVRAMALWKDIGMKDDAATLEKYKDRRRQVFTELFLMPHPFFRN